MVAILMMSAKLETAGLLKVNIFWNKGYDVVIFVYDVTNKILWCVSNYVVDMVMWPKFGISSISMRKVCNLHFIEKTRIWPEKTFFWGEFLTLGLALGRVLKFCTIVTKRLKLKVRKFLGLIPTFTEVKGKKLVGGGERGVFWPPSWIS